MFTFQQSTGILTDANDFHIGEGYAGHGDGLCTPSMQDVVGVGPLPRGIYRIGQPHDSPHTGKFTMDLEPDPANEMFGRSLFRIHGDNALEDHSASDGCIVMPLMVRLEIARAIGWVVDPETYAVTDARTTADDDRLEVIE